MSSRFGFSVLERPGGPPRRTAGTSRRPVMSDKQIEAYLITRDALRRLKRAALPPRHRPNPNVIATTQSENRNAQLRLRDADAA